MINRKKLEEQQKKEIKLFEKSHKKSKALFDRAKGCLLRGVPMNWMVRWAGSYPIFVETAEGAHFVDVDGNRYVDFCLGDTGSMVGHAPEASVKAISDAVKKGTTFMLPTEDAIYSGEELQKRFGMKYWQFTTSATDANRFILRLARDATGRDKVLAFNWCYHGSVDETVAILDKNSNVIAKTGSVGPQVNPALTTKLIEWNDVEALENALKDRDVAAVLAEPVMTNIGIIHPIEGYHKALRDLTKKYGTLLIIDETHTICTGVGGYTKAYGLEPDAVTIGKTIASGIPTGAYGMTKEFGETAADSKREQYEDVGGVGGTLAANALSMAAMRATLSEVLTQEFYDRNIPLAERFNDGVQNVIKEYDLPWNTTSLGCRTEYWFRKEPAKNGFEAEAAFDDSLDKYMHLASMNRGILMTPFHNMALITAKTSEEDVDYHTKIFREIVENILD
ncbi:MAG: aminotransferase class III-fold pyridoxal phosphate-dependent enzyme [Desulfobacterales bacterium]|nr:aminotransferase class III-fold pyridoxal phosphate-dependent enzyme [Desulfobacterales bacterium]